MRFLPRFIVFLALPFFSQSLEAQQPPSPPQETPATPNTGNPQTHSDGKKGQTRLIPSFLIIGTVFNEHALSFPGVQVRIRRTGEKKFDWETYTDARGEFAVRVPPGFDYEVVVHVKKYRDQTKTVDSRVDVQQRLSIQLELTTSGKTGGKS